MFSDLDDVLSGKKPVNHIFEKRNGMTALMVYSSRGNIPNIKKLIDMGADRFMKDKSGKTALLHAANKETARIILTYKTDAGGKKYNKLFQYAVKNKNTVIVHCLMDMDVVDVEALIGEAIISLDIEMINKCIEISRVKKAMKNPNRYLVEAAIRNKPEYVKECLKFGGKINTKDINGDSLLYVAIKHRSYSCAEELIKNGARTKDEKLIKLIVSRKDTRALRLVLGNNPAGGGMIVSLIQPDTIHKIKSRVFEDKRNLFKIYPSDKLEDIKKELLGTEFEVEVEI